MRRLWSLLLFMALFSAVFQLGSMSEVDEETARGFMDEFEELVADIDGTGIFLHNLTLALPMFIPGFGAGWGLFSAWSTGFAFAVLTTLNPALGAASPLAILYLTPFGFMELVAYSLGTSRSYILISLLIRRRSLAPAARVTLLEIAVVTALLLAGGIIEFQLIEMVDRGGFQLPGL